MGSQNLPTVQTVSTTRLYPTFSAPSGPKSVNLSIIDNTTAAYPVPHAIWFYNAPSSPLSPLSIGTLCTSLQKILTSYPQLCGSLERIPFHPSGTRFERYGRLRVLYNHGPSVDPGLAFIAASCNRPLADIIPAAAQRGRNWNATVVDLSAFAGNEIQLALHDGVATGNGLPAMGVQVTEFSCGGIAMAVKAVHPLVDARTLMMFMHEWAAVHVALSKGTGMMMPVSKAIFQPDLVDRFATKNIDAKEPDEYVVKAARALPQHRFDWYASEKGCPPALLPKTKRPAELEGAQLPALGEPIPWSDLAEASSISYYILQFSAEEVVALHKAASPEKNGLSEPKTSHLDALLSHIWSLIIEARGLPADDSIYFNMVMDFRSRFNPPLPATSTGTPAMMVYAESSVHQATAQQPLSALATAIRSSILNMNSSVLPCVLHDLAFQIDPLRYWQAFVGRHHVTSTSWLHHRVHEVDFLGTGQGPRFVEPVMPDFMICVMESASKEEKVKTTAGSETLSARKPWYANGVDVSLHFEIEVLEHMVRNPKLRAYDRSM